MRYGIDHDRQGCQPGLAQGLAAAFDPGLDFRQQRLRMLAAQACQPIVQDGLLQACFRLLRQPVVDPFQQGPRRRGWQAAQHCGSHQAQLQVIRRPKRFRQRQPSLRLLGSLFASFASDVGMQVAGRIVSADQRAGRS
jgi:hypothetical protein